MDFRIYTTTSQFVHFPPPPECLVNKGSRSEILPFGCGMKLGILSNKDSQLHGKALMYSYMHKYWIIGFGYVRRHAYVGSTQISNWMDALVDNMVFIYSAFEYKRF